MKYSIIALLSILSLMACDKPKKANTKVEKPVVKNSAELKEEVKPQTITLQEVARIALVEASQFLSNAKHEALDFSDILPIYKKAQVAYDKGQYKQAQKLAVKVRQLVEDLIAKK